MGIICSVAPVSSGYHVVAPSDMMDNRVAAIKQTLAKEGLGNKVSVFVIV